MKIPNDQLFDIDVLIFSSQKTATQTILSSLNEHGISSLHGHTAGNIGLTEALFKTYLHHYVEYKKKPLTIISVFRDPLDRMISSFFQSLSEDKYAYTHPNGEFAIRCSSESLLYKISTAAIYELLIHYCAKIDAWGESIPIICKAVDSEIESLNFLEAAKIGINSLGLCSLYLLRFDTMLPCLAGLLRQITKREIILRPQNLTNMKYYYDQHREFRESMALPADLIRQIYQRRKALMDLFYPGQFKMIVDARIRRYGR